jgi:uncharacterized protein (DUF1330 family)
MSYLKFLSGRRQSVIICLVAIGWLFFACQKASVNVSEPPSGPLAIKKILVLPFKDLSDLPGEHPDARSPVSGRIFITGDVADNAADFLTDRLVDWLQRNTDYEVRIPDYVQSSDSILDAAGGNLVLNREKLIALGRKLAVDAVVLGFVYRFRERVGKGFSAEAPASVAFDMHLIRVTDGRTVWSANFDETQQTLSENLFQLGTFLSRGGRWITAEEMAATGLNNILKKFPK